jgi:hypothetical protein
MTTLMTPANPRWSEFAERLEYALYIDDEHWRCDGDGDPVFVHRFAKQVMTEMGNIDIEGSLAFFHERGGHCDCEILFNIDPSDRGDGDGGIEPTPPAPCELIDA